jgi:hypothetical protein
MKNKFSYFIFLIILYIIKKRIINELIFLNKFLLKINLKNKNKEIKIQNKYTI